MGRITTRRPVTRVRLGHESVRRADTLAVEEPLEIRVAGTPLTVTMRTPGHDIELAAGFLVSEGVIAHADQFRRAIHCGGPGTTSSRQAVPFLPPPVDHATVGRRADAGPAVLEGVAENTYNVLDIALAPGVVLPTAESARAFVTTSACGVCGATSIEAIRRASHYDVAADSVRLDPAVVAAMPDGLRAHQDAFDRTGGIHAAGLFDAVTGEALVVREDVGRHNAVDKVIGWALLADRLPLRGTVLQVSGRASFELVQKAAMAGIPALSAVSAPSSLAAELAESLGLTLAGFVRGDTMNVYSRPDRLVPDGGSDDVT